MNDYSVELNMKKMEPKAILLMLEENSGVISDMIKAALYEVNGEIIDLLDFNDDKIFLEPSLFCYFLSEIPRESKMNLEQCLWGYIPVEKRPTTLGIKSDVFGWINFPNLGYISTTFNTKSTLDNNYIKKHLILDRLVPNSNIRLCLHPTEHLTYQKENLRYEEPIQISLEKHRNELESAVIFFQNHLEYFWRQVEIVTREFVVFSSPDYYSFAGIMQHGTAYFNVENKQKSEVFFIDDIAHQCGHIIFNTLTYDTQNYLKVPKDYPLNTFSPNPQEIRGVYGAFHGLFTYSTILRSLDVYLEKGLQLDYRLKHEALGRLGFYLRKFKYDLGLLRNSNIFTHAGSELFEEFNSNFFYFQKKWCQFFLYFGFANLIILRHCFYEIFSPIRM